MALERHAPMITVVDLIEKLKELPVDAVLVQSRDGEGNGFSPISELTLGVYLEDTTWSGEFTDCDEDAGDLRERGAVQSVCIWPTN